MRGRRRSSQAASTPTSTTHQVNEDALKQHVVSTLCLHVCVYLLYTMWT